METVKLDIIVPPKQNINIDQQMDIIKKNNPKMTKEQLDQIREKQEVANNMTDGERKTQLLDYFKAEMSLLSQGPVPNKIYTTRKNECLGCEFNKHKEHDSIGFCDQCGCGKNHRARLSSKLWMPNTTCPKEYWGPERGEGIGKLSKIGGVLGQVKDITKGFVKYVKNDNGER